MANKMLIIGFKQDLRIFLKPRNFLSVTYNVPICMYGFTDGLYHNGKYLREIVMRYCASIANLSKYIAQHASSLDRRIVRNFVLLSSR